MRTKSSPKPLIGVNLELEKTLTKERKAIVPNQRRSIKEALVILEQL